MILAIALVAVFLLLYLALDSFADAGVDEAAGSAWNQLDHTPRDPTGRIELDCQSRVWRPRKLKAPDIFVVTLQLTVGRTDDFFTTHAVIVEL